MEKLKIFGIITGICAIVSPILYWWGAFSPGYSYGTGLLNLWVYLELGATGITMLAMNLLLLVSGVFYLVVSFKPDLELLDRLKFLFLIIGFAGSLALNIMFIVLWEVPVFQIGPGFFIGLGPGLYIGIAALVIGILHKSAEK